MMMELFELKIAKTWSGQMDISWVLSVGRDTGLPNLFQE